jgi:hypothetical protein
LIEEEEKKTSHGPADTDGLSVVAVDGPLDAADLHLLFLDQHLTDGSFEVVGLENDSIKKAWFTSSIINLSVSNTFLFVSFS